MRVISSTSGCFHVIITIIMSKRVVWYVLGIIVIAGGFIRLWQLDSIPSGLHADEALTGYTAYSLLKTGKDLSGQVKLVGFRDTNIGGTFPSLLSWILVPFVGAFGLHTYVDRLPSALLGIVSILALFGIVKSLTRDTRIALIAAFLMSVNPWAIQISRQGLLESLSLVLVLSGTYYFLTASRHMWRYALSFALFALSLYSYDAPRLFLVPFLIVLTIYKWPHIQPIRWSVLKTSFIFWVIFGTVLYRIFASGVIHDYERSSVFDPQQIAATAGGEQLLSTAPRWLSRLFHNKVTVGYKHVLTSYVNIFSLDWFFVNGSGNLQRAVGNHGEYHLFELPLFFLGFFYVWTKKKRLRYLLLSWLLIGPLPGGLSSGSYIYRSVMMLPVPIMFSAYGLGVVLDRVSRYQGVVKLVTKVGTVVIIAVYISSYLFTYFFDYPVYASEWWSKEQNDAIRYGVAHQYAYSYVFFDGTLPWVTQYAFLTGLTPAVFHQNTAHTIPVWNLNGYQFGSLYFVFIPDDVKKLPHAAAFFPKGSLVIVNGNTDVFPKDQPVYTFQAPDHTHSVYKAVVVR